MQSVIVVLIDVGLILVLNIYNLEEYSENFIEERWEGDPEIMWPTPTMYVSGNDLW